MPESDNMRRLNFYLDDKTRERLNKLAEQTDRTVAKMLRRAIEEYLDREESALRRKKA